MKRLAFALIGLLLLVGLAAAGGLVYVRSSVPDPERGAVLAGLSAPVEVWRDSLSVPHAWAANETDLFRAMGYVHAQDRLWQMEFFRRVADGRMAEILGADLIDTDRFLRTVGMGRAAGENERLLDPQSRILLAAYADGVNAWIRDHPGALPPEFITLRFRPEPWTIRNTLAIGKIIAWDLASWNLDLDLQRAVDIVGPERARELRPEYPEWGTRILGEVPLPVVPETALRLLESVSAAHASNGWVIGGSRTRSGKPILANDMHLALRAPSLWYLAALHGGGFNVTGMTIPGTPVVVAGRSAGVAWGFTNAMVDDIDFYVERIHPSDSTLYQTPGGWQRFAVRPETIQVRGGQPIVHQVRTSRHGPIISGVEPRAGERTLAMRWTALDPSTEFRALIGMNRARTVGEFLQALRSFNNPHQNVVFADTSGAFGYWMSGRVPVRRSGDGVLPVPGWTDAHAWDRYLTFDEHPHALNPAEGFIVTANNRQVGPEYPHHITTEWAEPWRAMRIQEMVETGRAFTAADVAAQQMDVRDLVAVRYLPRAIRAAERANQPEAVRLLRAWNGEARADSRAAALFYTWYEVLRRRIGADEFGKQSMYFPRSTFNRILDGGDSPWVNDVGTQQVETLDELASAAMSEAADSVGTRVWGELHATRINHALGSVAALARALDLNIGPFPNSGSPNTVNVASYGNRLPFTNTAGASQRHVVDMA
ncbi:MAG: penicillin acylase family protein, partial [Gemmatimonadota bacterium]|nr:penicillin acylase family protein [Gemmatimonadota bacterium]